MKRACLALALALALAGGAQLAGAAYIHAKARLAQHLIARAWSSAQDGPVRAPWPGADLRPIARLTVPARHVDLYVLDNAGGRALAFGPGHLAGSAAPGGDGNAVIVAHRDTHFAFLAHLAPDDEIDVEAAGGVRARYRVHDVEVVDRSEVEVASPTADARLTLVTCYPFGALRPGTPWRYVVVAERVS